MNLKLEPYLAQRERWPASGQHIMAQYDDSSIVVYQAYNASIGRFAVEHQRLGGPFSFSRMSWIKPNFLWMMYRSGWGTKQNQEVTLAIRLKTEGFLEILRRAVPSTFRPDLYNSEAEWSDDMRRNPVRLQWDPDHDPEGRKQERRAIQLGLRDTVLQAYATEWIVEIQDISEFVSEQFHYVKEGSFAKLVTPVEDVFTPPADQELNRRIMLSTSPRIA